LLGLNAVEGWIDTQMFGEIGTRAYSTFQNPNVLGEFLVLILPICMSIVIVEKENISKIFYFLIASILFATLLLTFSRGSWVGILLSFAFATFLLNKQIFIILCVFFACAMPFFPKNVISRFLSIGNVLDSSTSYRVQIWLGTLRLIKKFWLFGIGAGEKNFSAVYPQFSYSAAVAEHSHNLFLQMFVESGAIGFSVFCLILLFFYRGLIISVKKMPKRSPEFVINLGLGSSIIGFLIQGLFDNCFYNYRIISIFWITLELGALSSHIIWENDCNKISGGDED
jgi:O-antigen ligase